MATWVMANTRYCCGGAPAPAMTPLAIAFQSVTASADAVTGNREAMAPASSQCAENGRGGVRDRGCGFMEGVPRARWYVHRGNGGRDGRPCVTGDARPPRSARTLARDAVPLRKPLKQDNRAAGGRPLTWHQ